MLFSEIFITIPNNISLDFKEIVQLNVVVNQSTTLV